MTTSSGKSGVGSEVMYLLKALIDKYNVDSTAALMKKPMICFPEV